MLNFLAEGFGMTRVFEVMVGVHPPRRTLIPRHAGAAETPGTTAAGDFPRVRFDPVQSHWRSALTARLAERRPVVVVDLPIEQLSQICLENDYRWRFHSMDGSANCYLLQPKAKPARPPADSEE